MDSNWQHFLKLCTKLKTVQEFDKLFELFLTLEEKEVMAKRYAIVKELLKNEKTQREMSKMLNVSIAKITRGSNELKTTPEDLKKLVLSIK